MMNSYPIGCVWVSHLVNGYSLVVSMSDVLLVKLVIACQTILYLQSLHLELYFTQLLCDELCLLKVVLAVEEGKEYLQAEILNN